MSFTAILLNTDELVNISSFDYATDMLYCNEGYDGSLLTVQSVKKEEDNFLHLHCKISLGNLDPDLKGFCAHMFVKQEKTPALMKWFELYKQHHNIGERIVLEKGKGMKLGYLYADAFAFKAEQKSYNTKKGVIQIYEVKHYQTTGLKFFTPEGYKLTQGHVCSLKEVGVGL